MRSSVARPSDNRASQRITLRHRHWDFAYADIDGEHGFTDAPDIPGKRIRVSASLSGQAELRYLLHEMLHACVWDADEETVDESSRDIAAVLWKFGWRKVESED